VDSAAAHIRFSMMGIAEQERLAVLNELYGPELGMAFDALNDEVPELDCDIHLLPGVAAIRARNSSLALRWYAPANGNETFMLNWSPSGGAGSLRHLGREVVNDTGHAFLTSGQETVRSAISRGFNPVQIRVARALLMALVPDAETRLMVPIPAASPALRLLTDYIGLLARNAADPSLSSSVAIHIRDLVAIALGVGGEPAAIARQGGLRAARLEAIKQWAIERLDRPGLSVANAAAAHRVSPRYIQMLFASEDSSFSLFVLKERLAKVYRSLTDPDMAFRTISDIVFDAGFGDLSYFNRVFRSTYGGTPSDIRNLAMERHRRG